MTMTTEEEYKLIKSEFEWTKKIVEEKADELEKANFRFNQAKFRYECTAKALDAFYVANPQYKTGEL